MKYGDSQDIEKNTKYFFPTQQDVLSMNFTTLSPCHKFIATSVETERENSACALIYEIDKQAAFHLKPKLIYYEQKTNFFISIKFSCLSISHDTIFLAGATDNVQDGILIYDWRDEVLVQNIIVEGIINQISFHPEDRFKMCTTGTGNLLNYWHFNNRYSNAAPILAANNKLVSKSRNYTCHVWLSSQQLLVGSTDGMLTIVKGCDIKQTKEAFPSTAEYDRSVSKIIVKCDMVIACSYANRIAVFEISKSVDGNVSKDVGLNLVLLNRYILGNYLDLRGIDWVNKSEFSLLFIAASASSMAIYNLDKFAEREEMPITLRESTLIANYHSKPISGLTIPCKSGIFASSSIGEEIVKVWDLSCKNNFSAITEKYIDGIGIPIHFDFHPTGRRILYGCDDYYREYAVAHSSLEILQEFPAKVTINGPNDEAFVNTNPISKVKYSNGGQYIAIISGSLYHMMYFFIFIKI